MNAFVRVSTQFKVMLCLYFTYAHSPLRNKLMSMCEPDKFASHYEPLHGSRSNPGLSATMEEKLMISQNCRRLYNHWFPRMSRFALAYNIFSTVIHSINFISNSILILNGDNNLKTLAMVMCYAPRTIFYNDIGYWTLVWLGWTASFLNLQWRITIYFFKREFAFDAILFILMDDKQLNQANYSSKDATKFYKEHRIVHPSHKILFYWIEDVLHNNVRFDLRFNRTPENRERLKALLDSSFIWASITSVFVASLSVCVSYYMGITRLHFFYEGCGISEGFDLINLSRLFVSSTITSIIMLDNITCLLYSTQLGAILTSDLKFYWHRIQSEMDKLANNLKLHEPSPTASRKLGKCRGLNSRNLDRVYQNLRVVVKDFFHLLHETDYYMSLLLNTGILIWLSVNATLTFTGFQTVGLKRSSAVYFVRGIQVTIFCALIVQSLLILTIKRSTESAYIVLNAIMAHDPSIDKRRWFSLLEYYTGKPRHAFTIGLSKVFTLGILLETLSATFTFFTYIQIIGSY